MAKVNVEMTENGPKLTTKNVWASSQANPARAFQGEALTDLTGKAEKFLDEALSIYTKDNPAYKKSVENDLKLGKDLAQKFGEKSNFAPLHGIQSPLSEATSWVYSKKYQQYIPSTGYIDTKQEPYERMESRDMPQSVEVKTSSNPFNHTREDM